MLDNCMYRRLFRGHVAEGLAAVGLSLFAHDLAGGDAGTVLVTALACRGPLDHARNAAASSGQVLPVVLTVLVGALFAAIVWHVLRKLS